MATNETTNAAEKVEQTAQTFEGWLNSWWIFAKSLATEWTLYQFAMIAVAFVVASMLARLINPHIEAALRNIKGRPTLLRILAVIYRRLRWILFVGLLWPLALILQEITWVSRSYFVLLAVKLATAWLLIAIVSRIIRNPTLRRVVAGFAWGYVALEMFGVLKLVTGGLEAVSFKIGTIDVSLWMVIKGLLLLSVLLTGANMLANFLTRQLSDNPDLTPSVRVLIQKFSKIALIVLAVMITLSTLGVDLSVLTFFSGAVGLGVGFGLQKVVSNLVSGIIILLDKSIKPGDVVSLENTFGWITSLNARYVSVITRDGREHLIPNEDLVTQKVINWSFSDRNVRLDIHFGVSYDANPHDVRRIACEAISKMDRLKKGTKPVCHVTGFGDSSVDFILRFWIEDPEGGLTNIRGAAFLALWDAFDENNISIPFPQREVTVKNQPANAA